MADMVRMEYTGKQAGAQFWTVEGAQYRGGANATDKYADVDPAHVEPLEKTGVWTVVKQPDPRDDQQQDQQLQQESDPLASLDADVRQNLAAAGFDSVEEIQAADDAALLDVEGVGKATLTKIREATA